MTVPMIGDRVRLSRDLGGHLTKGQMGLVVEIDPPNEDGSKPSLNLHVAIPWVRELPNTGVGKEWDGQYEGHKPVTLAQFHRGCIIPMSADELQYIDNIGAAQR